MIETKIVIEIGIAGVSLLKQDEIVEEMARKRDKKITNHHAVIDLIVVRLANVIKRETGIEIERRIRIGRETDESVVVAVPTEGVIDIAVIWIRIRREIAREIKRRTDIGMCGIIHDAQSTCFKRYLNNNDD